jgi:hypothetical protein
MIQKNFKKGMRVSKNAEFDADFELVENVVTNSCEKSYHRKSDRKPEFLTFISACKSFPPISLLCIL